ncbi:hypothetical protein ACHAXR_006783, partial [Thalassiosira sp. AJA248-18]
LSHQTYVCCLEKDGPSCKQSQDSHPGHPSHCAYIAVILPPDAHLLQATADMIIIVFFFLLLPGEYTDSPSDTTPFRCGDVQQLSMGRLCLDLDTAQMLES